MTNVTWLLLSSSLDINAFCFFYEKICLKEVVVLQKVFSNKIIVTLVTQGLPSSFLSRPVACVKFTIVLPTKPVSFLMFQLPSPSPISLSKTVSCNIRWSMVTKPLVVIDVIRLIILF